MISEPIKDRLLEIAKEAREHAYAPYSDNFKVGAAVLTEDGNIFAGCNIENSSFSATICAERVAVFRAVCEGHRKIKAIAIIADDPKPIPPCGTCLQVISEFGREADIIMANINGDIELSNVKNLFPKYFSLDR